VKPVEVCAAVIRRGNRYLLATRPPGSRSAGKWEFPGGKLRPGENHEHCIRRELREELGLEVGAITPIGTQLHPHLAVQLQFLACTVADTEQPQPKEGQRLAWVTLEQLETLELTPADRAFLGTLRNVFPSE